MTKTLESWSYSRWDQHNTCPLRFKLAVLEGHKEPENDGMVRGKKIHDAAKDYLLGPADAVVPALMNKQSDLIYQIRTKFDNVVVEQQWGFNRQWSATGWFSKAGAPQGATWLRSIIDVGVLYEDNSVEVIDWKSGKPRGTHEDQMELFAVSVLVKYPFVTAVDTRLAYTDFDKAEFGGPYPRADLEKLIAKWEAKVAPMFEDTAYLPRPGDACRFCPFSRSNSFDKFGQHNMCRFG